MHAHHSNNYLASLAGGEVVAARFVLSPNHFRPHLCDLQAGVNRHGLGAGVYPLDRYPRISHWHYLSTAECVFEDEITATDRLGREDCIAWLMRQAPEMQLGVLGHREKVAMLKDGTLQEFQITVPWRLMRETRAEAQPPSGVFPPRWAWWKAVRRS